MPVDVKAVKKRYEQLKADRSTLDQHCEEIAQVMFPGKLGFTGERTPGEKRNQRIYDSTGVHSVDLCAAGMHGLASNPATRWFGVKMVEPDLNEKDPVKDWLSNVEKVMRAQMYSPGSNLTTAMHEVYQELGAFGTAVMFIGERDDGGLHYQSRPLSECYIAENHEQTVDTVIRPFKMSARQIMQNKEWAKNASDEIKQKATEKPDELFDLIHCVMPRSDRNPSLKDSKNHKFAEYYIDSKTDTCLEEGGYPEFPYACPRWSKRPGEVYGRSPGMIALPDVQMLQEAMKSFIKAMQKSVDPAIWLPDDGVIGPVRTMPGGLNYWRGQNQPFYLDSVKNYPAIDAFLEELRNRIRTVFFADILQIVTDKEMTAYEVAQRTTERMRLLGPVIGRLESEMLGPIISRTYAILTRRRQIPDPPSLEGEKVGTLTVEYVSPIARAQKQGDINTFTMVMGAAMPFAEINPAIFDRLDTDEVLPWLADAGGLDQNLIMNDDDYEAFKEQKQAQQAAAVATPIAADAAAKGAGAIESLASAQEKGADVANIVSGLTQRRAA